MEQIRGGTYAHMRGPARKPVLCSVALAKDPEKAGPALIMHSLIKVGD